MPSTQSSLPSSNPEAISTRTPRPRKPPASSTRSSTSHDSQRTITQALFSRRGPEALSSSPSTISQASVQSNLRLSIASTQPSLSSSRHISRNRSDLSRYGSFNLNNDPESRRSFYKNILKSPEYKHYFEKGQDGRVYHRVGDSESGLLLPVDAEEPERKEIVHNVLLSELGANYLGPVVDVLQSRSNGRPEAIDVRTGEGQWVYEMAAQFLHTQFFGLNNDPSYKINLPQNLKVVFNIYDPNVEGSAFDTDDESMDLVHARDLATSTINYQDTVLSESIRVLRRGGLFIAAEWNYYINVNSKVGFGPRDYAPASCRFFDKLRKVLEGRVEYDLTDKMRKYLEESGAFLNIVQKDFGIPIGNIPWGPEDKEKDEKRELFRRAEITFARGCKRLFLDSGLKEEVVFGLIEGYVELERLTGLVRGYTVFYATKM